MSNSITNFHYNYKIIKRNENDEKINKYYGDPNISISRNIMLNNIQGNCTLNDSQLICLYDFHYHFEQKYIRAAIINDVLQFRNISNRKIVILLEGTESGIQPSYKNYNTLVGYKLIRFKHYVFGWDNQELCNLSINNIHEIQNCRSEIVKLQNERESLNKRKLYILLNAVEDDEIDEITDTINPKIYELDLKIQQLSNHSYDLAYKIKNISKKRNENLLQSINYIVSNHLNSIIFVVAGENHFEDISKKLSKISHCILNIKKIREINNIDEAMKEVYGDSTAKGNVPKLTSLGFNPQKPRLSITYA